MKKIFLLFFLSLTVYLQGIPEEILLMDFNNAGRTKAILSWKYQLGDNPVWSQPDHNDNHWEQVHLYQNFVKTTRGIHWYKTRIETRGEIKQFDNLVVLIRYLPLAYEVFWDGHLIKTNGKIDAEQESEDPGRYRNAVNIPREYVKSGAHVLALRVSNFGKKRTFPYTNIYLGTRTVIENGNRNYLEKVLLFVGIYLTALFFALALYLGGARNPFYLFFIFYCFINLISSYIGYYSESSGLSLYKFEFLNKIDTFGTGIDDFILIVFLLLLFQVKKKYWNIFSLILVMVVFQVLGFVSLGGFPTNELFMNLFGIYLLIFAIRAGKKGSLIILVGFSLRIFVYLYRFFAQWMPEVQFVHPKFLYTIVQGLFLAAIIMGISKKIRWETRRIQKIKLRTQRLETELLKKNIQPHFIMNTLQSIKSLIQIDQDKAEGLIESLAEEFRIINRIHSKSTIAIEEEIDLCRHHLQLMGYRRDAQYELEVSSSCKDFQIPPMILHTLIENGLTHAFNPREKGAFSLNCNCDTDVVSLTLSNNGSKLKEFSSQPSNKIEEGLGLKYVRTRLEESFSGQWDLKYGLFEKNWEVKINFKKTNLN